MSKYIYASLVVIICFLIIANIDKLKTKKPENNQQYVNSADCNNVPFDGDIGFQLTTGIASIASSFLGYLGSIGTVGQALVGNAISNVNQPEPCVGVLHNEYIDERSNFNYEKIIITAIALVLIILILKK